MTSYRRSYVFRLACDPALYLWTGHGDLDTPADAIEPSGARWRGAGELLSIPALRQLINGAADRVEFTLSGVSALALAAAIEDRDSVNGAATMIGYVDFDDAWQMSGGVVWEWLGIADVITTTSGPSGRGRQRTISLSVASADTARGNPSIAFFTDADQRKRSPTDAIFSHVGQITIGMARRWGPS